MKDARIGETIVNDDEDNVCFGCSPHNARGLQLRFVRTSANTVESHVATEPHWAGAPGVVHGGLQAAMLDEVLGMTAHSAFDGESAKLATLDFRLRYRRPVVVGERLTIRGELVRREDRDVYVEGVILDASNEVLTLAEARWRRIG